MLTMFKNLFKKTRSKNSVLMPESLFHVTVTEEAIETLRPEGKVERVEFSRLKAVIIETNDTGPWGTDVWWILVGSDESHGCVFPGGAT